MILTFYLLQDFFNAAAAWKPDLIIIAGVHLLDGHKEVLWKDKLLSFTKKLKALPKNVPVHLEVASMADKRLAGEVLKHVSNFFRELI